MKKIMFLMMVFGGLFFIAAADVSAQSCNPAPNQIAIFEHWDFQGKCKVLNVGQQVKFVEDIGFENDTISGVKVGKNATLTLCEHIDFGGGCKTFTSDNARLDDLSFNDMASSIKVAANKSSAGGNEGRTGGGNNQAGSNANAGKCSPSDNSLQKVDLAWLNATNQTLEFQWVDFNCKEVFYQKVEPDSTFEQESFITHVWNIYKVDANGGKKLHKKLVVNSSNTSTTIQ